MIFQSIEFTGRRPFKDVLIHGLIRDEQGRKMSKSLGNGIDPMDVIDKYGADPMVQPQVKTFVSPIRRWMQPGTLSTRSGTQVAL